MGILGTDFKSVPKLSEEAAVTTQQMGFLRSCHTNFTFIICVEQDIHGSYALTRVSMFLTISSFGLSKIVGTKSFKSSSIMHRFWAVGIMQFASVTMPFLSIVYSWNSIPLGASTMPTPVPNFFGFFNSSFLRPFDNSLSIIFMASSVQ